jgi:Fe-S cluster biogenesis protein NfuA
MQQELQGDQSRAKRIETLIEEVSAFTDPHARATTEELIQAILDMYGEGLARILELTTEAKVPGPVLVETLAKDELVGSLFMLHGLHPIAVETRIARALTEVGPYLKSHGGSVQFERVECGVAYLRLEGRCGVSASTLISAIEEAIYKVAPDLDDLQIEDNTTPAPPPGIPIRFVPPRRHKEALQAARQNGVKRGV